ncbi:MAG TPA: glycosyltransferase, partial [Wenzhouxiangellaceae bacterium]|nr:glycosyltransferase [Wenzhouxiangellaceae bacterium]
ATDELPGHHEPSAQWRKDGRFRVFGVGRLSRYKGFGTLIRAVAGVDEVQLIIAGDGDQRSRLERFVPDHARGRVRLVGGVDDATRNRLMSECDLFCLPSISRAEAFGLSLVEAMAAGKAQLATRVAGSGMDWVVEEGRTGWMVDSGDIDALAHLLRRLARERGMVVIAGEQSRERFETRFRIDAVAREIVGVYEALAR